MKPFLNISMVLKKVSKETHIFKEKIGRENGLSSEMVSDLGLAKSDHVIMTSLHLLASKGTGKGISH